MRLKTLSIRAKKKEIKNNNTRKFLGKTEGFKDKEERSFNQRMLKAYLKGYKYFHFGRNVLGHKKEHLVMQEYN